MINPQTLEEMFQGALEALIWTATDEWGDPLDPSVEADIDPEDLDMFRGAVEGLALTCLQDTITMLNHYDSTDRGKRWSSGSLWGHDFVLTSQGQWAGFWDRGEPSGAAQRLTDMCVSSYELYVGNDGKAYIQ